MDHAITVHDVLLTLGGIGVVAGLFVLIGLIIWFMALGWDH